MKQWTFGVVTGGDVTAVNSLIDSIEIQGIPEGCYEIIVVGGPKIERKNVRHVPFDENIKSMWITKKKQIACENASFENVVLTHDYLTFDPGWYDGWLKFGDNDWDVAMNCIYNGDGQRFRDWLAHEPHATVPYDIVGYLPIMYISGTYWVAKRDFMLKHSLDLKRGWCEAEDIEWSMRCRDLWNYKMNPHSSVRSNKVKETWQILDENGVQANIHYRHLQYILSKRNVRVIDNNGVMELGADRGVKSIHYSEFDTLRNDVRRIKPKNIIVLGDPLGFSAFAAQWGSWDNRKAGIDANVVIVDYVAGHGLTVNDHLTEQFKWNAFTYKQTIDSAEQLENLTFKPVDMVILCGTYPADIKLRELKAVKEVFGAKAAVFVINTISDEIRKELPGGAQIGGIYRAAVVK